MQNLLREGRRPRVLAAFAFAVIAALMATLPGAASAQNTLSLSVEPPLPRAGQPFALVATGTSQQPDPISGGGNDVEFGFAPGEGLCASTAELEFANPDRVHLGAHNVNDGPFDLRPTYSGGPASGGITPPPYAARNGVVVGKYRACGYLYASRSGARSAPPFAAARLDFTVGGTCDTATDNLRQARQNLRKARRGLNRARRGLRRARSTGTRVKRARRNVRQARTRVKQARRNVRRAQTRQSALC